MNITKPQSINKTQLADIAVLLLLSALVIWYFFDAYSASADRVNLLFVLPVTVIILILCLVEFVAELRGRGVYKVNTAPLKKTGSLIVLFGVYVSTLKWLGFDIGTFLFVATVVYFYGQRHWQWALAYGLSFSLTLCMFFSSMLPYPMPMFLLTTLY